MVAIVTRADISVITTLIEAGANVNAVSWWGTDGWIFTPLMAALDINSETKVLDAILQESNKTGVNLQDKHGDIALHQGSF